MTAAQTAFAPAKVNLFLHVGAPGADGFHPVASLMVFADIGDRLSVEAGADGLRIEGEFANGLSADGENLVLLARDALLARAAEEGRSRREAVGLILDKRLPIASGLGGGSSDAAAALRLLNEVWELAAPTEALEQIARSLGSDTAACVSAQPVVATGRGEVLRPAPSFPDLPAVLVNPRVASPTGPVYRAYDQAVARQGANLPAWPASIRSPEAMADWLGQTRNDLEAPAIALAPQIADTLAALRASPAARLVRMSGSGATCFALTATMDAASHLAREVAERRPDWWVRPCRLGSGQG